MAVTAYDLSAGLFVRGLTNLKSQLTKAADQAAATGMSESALLGARIDGLGSGHDAPGYAPRDLHGYTLAAQVHWAAEGARLAIARLLGAPAVPAANEETTFADLHRRLDEAITYVRETVPGDLEAGFDRTIVIEHPRGSVTSPGGQFLVGYAIPHFFYHVTSAYAILRNQGVQLTMGDFLGDWGTG